MSVADTRNGFTNGFSQKSQKAWSSPGPTHTHSEPALTSNQFSINHMIFTVTLEKRFTHTEGMMNVEGDVVLIYHQEKPAVYARIENIEPDIKKDWYRVTLLFLTLPAQEVTWILKESYINGDAFTMNGDAMRIDAVKKATPKKKADEEPRIVEEKEGERPSNVIPFKR